MIPIRRRHRVVAAVGAHRENSYAAIVLVAAYDTFIFPLRLFQYYSYLTYQRMHDNIARNKLKDLKMSKTFGI